MNIKLVSFPNCIFSNCIVPGLRNFALRKLHRSWKLMQNLNQSQALMTDGKQFFKAIANVIKEILVEKRKRIYFVNEANATRKEILWIKNIVDIKKKGIILMLKRKWILHDNEQKKICYWKWHIFIENKWILLKRRKYCWKEGNII